MPLFNHIWALILVLIMLVLLAAAIVAIIVASNLITHRLLNRTKQ